MSAPVVTQPTLDGVAEVVELYSVTTLYETGLGKGEGLIRYGDRQIATTAVDMRAILGRRVEEDGYDETVKWLMQKRYTKSEKAKLRGTIVHKAAERINLGAEPEVEPEYEPYVEQYRRWLAAYAPRFLMAEAPVYNVTHKYAGTLDAIVELGEHAKPLVLDMKTTDLPPDGDKARPPWPEVALQLAAYSRAELVGVVADRQSDDFRRRTYKFDPTSSHEPMPEVDLERGLCVVISPYDCFAVPVRIDDAIFRFFLHAVWCAHFKMNYPYGRGLFGPPLATPLEPR